MSKEPDTFRYHLADLRQAFPNQKLLTRREFADYLGFTRVETIYDWDTIPTIKTGKGGKSVRIPIISAAFWLSGRDQ